MSGQHRDRPGGRALVDVVDRRAAREHRRRGEPGGALVAENPEMAERALYRALELFDLTLADPRLRESPERLREVARAREVVADFFAGPNQYRSDATSLQKYFDAYAVAVRLRGRVPSDSTPQARPVSPAP